MDTRTRELALQQSATRRGAGTPGVLSTVEIAAWARARLQSMRERSKALRATCEARPGDRANGRDAAQIESMLDYGSGLVATVQDLLHLGADPTHASRDLAVDWSGTSRQLVQDACEIRFAAVQARETRPGRL